MDNLIYILFICTVAPLFLLLLLLRKRSKLIVGYMLIGIFVSLFVSELNTILLNFFGGDSLYVTTVITPISEEIVKAAPVLFYAMVFSDDRDKLMTIAFATGIGFAMFENMVILLQNIENVTVGLAIVRGFSTALMHGVCTAAVGYGMSFIKKRRKLFYCGTVALLTLASIYHGIFNMLVQSEYKYLGFILPALTYIPVVYYQVNGHKSKSV
ncbi:MAG: PrsW family intramembrane metalloprotease [Clostridia bacterium]|nr:PrsW family intramembrane metalloprotease [Clostridia bacterium]